MVLAAVYTERAPRWQQFHVAADDQNSTGSTPLRWIFKTALCKATCSHSFGVAYSAADLLGSREQRPYIAATVKRLGLIFRWSEQTTFMNKLWVFRFHFADDTFVLTEELFEDIHKNSFIVSEKEQLLLISSRTTEIMRVKDATTLGLNISVYCSYSASTVSKQTRNASLILV